MAKPKVWVKPQEKAVPLPARTLLQEVFLTVMGIFARAWKNVLLGCLRKRERGRVVGSAADGPSLSVLC